MFFCIRPKYNFILKLHWPFIINHQSKIYHRIESKVWLKKALALKLILVLKCMLCDIDACSGSLPESQVIGHLGDTCIVTHHTDHITRDASLL